MSIYNIFLGYGGISQYLINNSLRLRSSASAYLNRTCGSPTNNIKWTYSVWVKLGIVSGSGYNTIFSGGDGTGNNQLFITVQQSTGNLIYREDSGGPNVFQLVTNQVFRDPSSWYHIVAVYDTANATSSNRVLIYVNGIQVTSFSTATYPSQNQSCVTNTSGRSMWIGLYPSASYYLDGYLAEVNFIDGQALTPSAFGAYSTTTGVWQPSKYTGTYGTNGFYLPFSNTTSTTTLGYDFSGNGNNWTTNNISLTAGSTYDSMTDVPTLTSATASNYAVLNPLATTRPTITDGNITVSGGSSYAVTTINMTSGKWYCEITCVTVGSESSVGLTTNVNGGSGYVGNDANSWGYYSNGNKYTNSSSSSYGSSYTSGDVIGIAFDAGAGTLTFYKNNVSQGTAFTGLTSGPYYFAVEGRTAGGTNNAGCNFGQQPFKYTPPSGFSALNTYNLPTPAIANGALYNAATLYTGTGSSQSPVNSQSNGGNNALGKTFEPDLTWIKSRSAATDHKWTDTVRGVTKALVSDSTSAETTDTNGLTAFSSNGFTVGTDTNYNNSGATYVAWQWNAGSGTSGSNTNGSITSTVSVNQTAGFSIVTYTGTGSAATVGHGLGVAPSMIITKKRSSTSDWGVYHTSIGNTNYLLLDSTAASASSSTYWNNTSPTSSVFSIGTADPVNVNTATYVAYCWAAIAGYSAFGIYTGNGSTDGPFVYCGFRPRWVMVKSSTVSGSSSEWLIKDTSRDTYNVAQNTLTADSSQAEFNGSNQYIDILSNGFKIRNATGAYNNSTSDTYIYAAFAENPFRNALAR